MHQRRQHQDDRSSGIGEHEHAGGVQQHGERGDLAFFDSFGNDPAADDADELPCGGNGDVKRRQRQRIPKTFLDVDDGVHVDR